MCHLEFELYLELTGDLKGQGEGVWNLFQRTQKCSAFYTIIVLFNDGISGLCFQTVPHFVIPKHEAFGILFLSEKPPFSNERSRLGLLKTIL